MKTLLPILKTKQFMGIALWLWAIFIFSEVGMTWSLGGRSPSTIATLQFAGEPETVQAVRNAFKSVGISNVHLVLNTIFDFFFILFYSKIFINFCDYAENYYDKEMHVWLNNNSEYFKKFVKLAVCFDIIENILILIIVTQLSSHTSIPAWISRSVFWLASAKMFSLGVVAWYVLGGVVKSPKFRGIWEAIRWCGFSLFAAIFGPGLLIFGGQGQAVFSALQTNVNDGHWISLLWTMGATFFFSLMCWGYARLIIDDYDLGIQGQFKQIIKTFSFGNKDLNTTSKVEQQPGNLIPLKNEEHPNSQQLSFFFKEVKIWTPRILGFIPGLILSKIAFSAVGPKPVFWLICLSSIMAMIFIVFRRKIVLLRWKIRDKSSSPTDQQVNDYIAASDTRWSLGVLILGLLLAVYLSWNPAHLLDSVSLNMAPIATWLVSFSLMVPVFSLVVRVGRKKRIPILGMALTYALLINAGDFNDNHGVRYKRLPIATERRSETERRPTLNAKFDCWLQRPEAVAWRNNKDHKNKPYPVVFVAAAGGGITAAAVFSVSMQELQKSGEEHLFAISGVSGGSFGAVVYAAQRMAKKTEARVGRDILTTDMLSPTVASLFSPELIQRFSPWAWSLPDEPETGYRNASRTDRGRALDLALASAASNVLGNPMYINTTLAEYSRYDEKLNLPVLLLNATEVESGQRMVMATVRPDGENKAKQNLPFETLYDIDPRIDIPLATAASLSARFPGFSPPGFLPQQREVTLFEKEENHESKPVKRVITVKRRYVDGGYCENSGVQTLLDVITALEKSNHAGRPDWVPVVISIHYGQGTQLPYDRSPEWNQVRASNPRRSAGFDEILDPLRAFFNGWGGPAGPVFHEARIRFGNRFIELSFPKPETLGWYLSKTQYDVTAVRAKELFDPNGVKSNEGKRLRQALAGSVIDPISPQAIYPIIGPDR